MNQNIAYFSSSNNIDHRQGANSQPYTSTVEFHPASATSGFHNSSNQGAFHTNTGTTFVTNNLAGQPHTLQAQNAGQRLATVVPVSSVGGQQPGTVHVQLLPQGGSPVTSQQHIIIATQPLHTTQAAEPDDRRMAAFMEYFVEQQPVCSTVQTNAQAMQYQNPGMVTKYAIKNKMNSAEKNEKELVKRAKQAEAARQRYHRLTSEEKKALNLKRTLAQKRKRQREKELAELESILRQSNDIVDDPEVTEQLREKRMRARWAEAARTRYQRMTSEERRIHNNKRRLRQVSVKIGEKGEPLNDDTARQRIKDQNAKKAEAARLRYHRMNPDEKKMYNQRRTEAFRRRRMEEEALLAMPIGRINGEALDRAQQIVVRNAKRAEAARLRYQRMTPEQRKSYNQKRYTPKRKREQMGGGMDGGDSDSMKGGIGKTEEDEFDALSSLERDVLRRTHQAHQALQRQRQGFGTPNGPVQGGTTPMGSHQLLLNRQPHTPQQQIHVQQGNGQGHPIQVQYTTGGQMVVGQHIQQQQPQLITTYTTQHPNA
ncbi:Gex interacting protein 4, isoform c [Ditylenchus destructor]|nr:Gex interacting protein 4, isoform c [Ditylenchus destructor]